MSVACAPSETYDKTFIRSTLPHGDNFIFLDHIDHFDPEAHTIAGQFYVDPLDHRYEGHFDKEKIFPAVFQTEALAQLSGILLHLTAQAQGNPGTMAFLTNNHLAFKSVVRPDNTLLLNAKIKTRFGSTTEFTVSSFVGKKLTCKGTVRLTAIPSIDHDDV